MNIIAGSPTARRARIEPEPRGDIKARDCLVRYRRGGKLLAVASIYRDLENLRAELAMELA